MEKIRSGNIEFDVQNPIHMKDGSLLYNVGKNQIAKIFSSEFLKHNEEELVKKLMDSEGRSIDGVVMPKDLIYTSSGCIGYTMDRIDGVTDIKYEKGLIDTKGNLFRLAKKYKELEAIVRNAGNDVVFPSLLDRSNIMVDKNGKIIVVNYDRLQVGESDSFGRASGLGKIEDQSKYYDHFRNKYTKELDVLSLYYYYFKLAFGADLGNIIPEGCYNQGDVCTLEIAFKHMNIPEEVQDKVFRLFEPMTNEYLGDSVDKIAKKYTLKSTQSYYCTHKLVEK